ncbi:hypothetical protein G9A89_009671 [Geosiphon pyriformis]|nr:hypothetical protein G9A89_009671 [Geosiphon pyriformis]
MIPQPTDISKPCLIRQVAAKKIDEFVDCLRPQFVDDEVSKKHRIPSIFFDARMMDMLKPFRYSGFSLISMVLPELEIFFKSEMPDLVFHPYSDYGFEGICLIFGLATKKPEAIKESRLGKRFSTRFKSERET